MMQRELVISHNLVSGCARVTQQVINQVFYDEKILNLLVFQLQPNASRIKCGLISTPMASSPPWTGLHLHQKYRWPTALPAQYVHHQIISTFLPLFCLVCSDRSTTIYVLVKMLTWLPTQRPSRLFSVLILAGLPPPHSRL